MFIDHSVPAALQYQPNKIELDESIVKAKAALLGAIKRSVYIYRVDCGGCNGCEIEIFSTITPVFDAERFGIKNTPSPRHADIMVYTGAMTRAMRMPALRAYAGAPSPKLVVAYGACGCTGGIFHDNYCVWGGTDKLIPVDVYIPGCPPSPAQTIYGFAITLGLLAQKLTHTHIVETEGEQAPLPAGNIPYEVWSLLRRKARLMSGYRQGGDMAESFFAALGEDNPDVMGTIDALIARQDDPRCSEFFQALKAELSQLLVAALR
jgi:Ni,Fe-hydrogenase III small subunit